MGNDIIEYIENDFYVGSWKLSNLFEVEHRSLKRTIKNNMKDVVEVGDSELKTRTIYANSIRVINNKINDKKGRPVVEYLLNEPQASFIVLLLRGQYKHDKVDLIIKFKKHITDGFFKQRKIIGKLLIQKQNAEWLQKRSEGKIERRAETDVIKNFVEYASLQGSKNAEKYYMIISKMQNQTLFNLEYLTIKYPNIRDIAEGFQLDTLIMADRIVAKAIKEGMNNSMNYKDIYVMCKNRVEQFALVIGKTPLQLAYRNELLLT
ncbi:MAG: Rha family transcriptional regulator [Bacteroidales bacterium]|jgi:phage regulator Rha-like protein